MDFTEISVVAQRIERDRLFGDAARGAEVRNLRRQHRGESRTARRLRLATAFAKIGDAVNRARAIEAEGAKARRRPWQHFGAAAPGPRLPSRPHLE